MFKPSIDDMLAGKQSRYSLVIGVAKRAREITDEIQKDKTKGPCDKPVIVAVEEFKDHKFAILEPDVDD